MKQTHLCLTLLLAVNVAQGHDLHPLAAASSFFSQLLYQKIALNETKVVYSPYSTHAILTMISHGANGVTRDEIFRLLGLINYPVGYEATAYQTLIPEEQCGLGVYVSYVNVLLVQPQQPILQTYLYYLRTFFFTGVGSFNFQVNGGPEVPINAFVERKTGGHITNLLPKGYITQDTSLLALSTLTFNGTWKYPFEPQKITVQDFVHVCESGTSDKLQFVNAARYVNVRTGVLGADVLELPYAGDRVSLYLALPRNVQDLTAFESSLTNPDNVNQLFTGFSQSYASISIPKFRVQSKFSLSQPLQQLGVGRVFYSAYAELQGISQNSLHVTEIVHSAAFEFDVAGSFSGPATPVEPPSNLQAQQQLAFKADRPFLFFLRDNLSQQLLLQGKFSG